jgi:acetoin:2,6-dichlorophenolindophenol oxidoreductase subunit alpha
VERKSAARCDIALMIFVENISRHNRQEGTGTMQMNRDELLRAYRAMRTIRDFEERLHIEFATGEIPGFVHLYAGEEASAVGVCMHLTERDKIASTHRGHGHCIAKGVELPGMMAEIYGRRDGLCGGKGGSMHIADLSKGMLGANGIVGGGPPLICGAALTAKVLKTGGVAVAFYGDGASNQGTTLESLNLATIWRLPAIFVCEDNGYAESTSSSYSVGGSQVKRGEAFGMPCQEVDGFDFFAVHEAARVAIERARNGDGPSMMHLKLTRYYGHFEGDAMTYRAPGEVDRIRAEQDCIGRFRQRVIAAALLENDDLATVDKEVADELESSVRAAKVGPLPDEADLLTDVYVAY